jgi:hypothetical protein
VEAHWMRALQGVSRTPLNLKKSEKKEPHLNLCGTLQEEPSDSYCRATFRTSLEVVYYMETTVPRAVFAVYRAVITQTAHVGARESSECRRGTLWGQMWGQIIMSCPRRPLPIAMR